MVDGAVTDILPNDSPDMAEMPGAPADAAGSMLESLAHTTQTDPAELPLVFQFTWHGIAFTAKLYWTQEGHNSILELRANIGTLPFTAENVSVRNMLIERLRRSQFNLGREIVLTSGSAVEVEMKTLLARQVHPREAIEVVSTCLLLAKEDLAEIRSILGPTRH